MMSKNFAPLSLVLAASLVIATPLAQAETLTEVSNVTSTLPSADALFDSGSDGGRVGQEQEQLDEQTAWDMPTDIPTRCVEASEATQTPDVSPSVDSPSSSDDELPTSDASPSPSVALSSSLPTPTTSVTDSATPEASESEASTPVIGARTGTLDFPDASQISPTPTHGETGAVSSESPSATPSPSVDNSPSSSASASPRPSISPSTDPSESPSASSSPSPSSSPVTSNCPETVTGVAAEPGVNLAVVSWQMNEDGASPEGFYVQVTGPEGFAKTVAVPAPATKIDVAGLKNGVDYSFRVTAATRDGSAPASKAVTATPTTGMEGVVAGLIVEFQPGSEKARGETDVPGEERVQDLDLTVAEKVSDDAVLVELSEPVDVDTAARIADDLAADPEVAWAEPDQFFFTSSIRSADAVQGPAMPDGLAQPVTVPTDGSYASDQWNLWDTYGISIGAGPESMTDAWAGPRGDGVTVGVIDTGITTHPDLDNQLVAGYDFVSNPEKLAASRQANAPPVDFDGDYVDSTTYGALGRDGNPSDPGDWREISPVRGSSWHGTEMAGIIAAEANDAGITGIAPNAKIQPIRALSWRGGLLSDIAASITWASGGTVDGVPANTSPSKVINMSFAVETMCPVTLQNAIDGAIERGSILVAAAGNANDDASNYAPGNCNGVITVGATNRDGKRADYSNHGDVVDISAPGGDSTNSIASTSNSGMQLPMGAITGAAFGTSVAAAHVSSAAAILASRSVGLTSEQAYRQLTGGEYTKAFGSEVCDPANPDFACGSGILSLGPALAQIAAYSTSLDTAADFNGTNQYGSMTNANFTISGSATLELWAKPDACSTAYCPAAGNLDGYMIAIRSGTWQVYSRGTWLDSGVAPRYGSWQHIAMTNDGSDLKAFVDGTVATSTTPGSGSTTAQSFYVARNGSSGTSYFNGQVDEVKLYNATLSAAQIQTDMHTWAMATGGSVTGDNHVLHLDFNSDTSTMSFISNMATGASKGGTTFFMPSNPTLTAVESEASSSTVTSITFPRSYLTQDGGWTVPVSQSSASVLVVAGGGGGGTSLATSSYPYRGAQGAGGGAGGAWNGTENLTTGNVLNIVVGQGGLGALPGSSGPAIDGRLASNGQDSDFGSDVYGSGSNTPTGGGAGGSYGAEAGSVGGSGGGGLGYSSTASNGGSAASAGLWGNDGGGGVGSTMDGIFAAGGGGGAGGAGDPGSLTVPGSYNGLGGSAGAGIEWPASSGTYYAAGGAGGGCSANGSASGAGRVAVGSSASPNTGSGGGGGYAGSGCTTSTSVAGSGGSGIIIVSYATPYTLSYSATDATSGSVPSSESVGYNTTTTVQSAGTLGRTGYTFAGWRDTTAAVTYSAGSSLTMPARNVTLTALWSVNSYTYSFNSAGGDSTPVGRTISYGSSTGPYCYRNPIKAGYTFTGWQSDYDSVTYGTQSSCSTGYMYLTGFTMPASNVVFTAQYAAISYVVTFDSKGGSAIADGSYTTGGSITEPSNPTKAGYTFGGWSLTDGGSAITWTAGAYAPGGYGDLTLYALWTANTYAVTLDPQGGSVSPTTIGPTFGSSVTLPAPVRSGYTFAAWTTAAGGSGDSYAAGSVTWNTDLGSNGASGTLYAQWAASSYTVTYDADGGVNPPAVQAENFGATVTVAGPGSMTKSGYVFSGWSSSLGGSTLSPGATFTMPSTNVTLTAGWTLAPTPSGSSTQSSSSQTSVIVRPNSINDGWEALGSGFAVSVQAQDFDRRLQTLNQERQLTVPIGGWIEASGEGFAAGSVVTMQLVDQEVTTFRKRRALPSPVTLQSFLVRNDGTFSTDDPLPASTPPGSYMLVMEGLTQQAGRQTLLFPLLIVEAAEQPGEVTQAAFYQGRSLKFSQAGRNRLDALVSDIPADARDVNISVIAVSVSLDSLDDNLDLARDRAKKLARALEQRGLAGEYTVSVATSFIIGQEIRTRYYQWVDGELRPRSDSPLPQPVLSGAGKPLSTVHVGFVTGN